MMSAQEEVTIELRPEARLDVINVTERITQQIRAIGGQGVTLWGKP